MGLETKFRPILEESFFLKEIKTQSVWVDGKPVFRRAFDIEGLADNAVLIPSFIVDTFISVSGSGDIAATTRVPIPYNQGNPPAVFVGANITTIAGANQVILRRSFAQSAGSFIILEYTKQ